MRIIRHMFRLVSMTYHACASNYYLGRANALLDGDWMRYASKARKHMDRYLYMVEHR